MVNSIAGHERTLKELVREPVRPFFMPATCCNPHIEQAVAIGMHSASPIPASLSLFYLGQEAVSVGLCTWRMRHTNMIPLSIRACYIGERLMAVLS